MMTASLVAFDLSTDDAETVMKFFNGDWSKSGVYTHYCLGRRRCPFQCDGAAGGKLQATTMARLALGMGLVVGLLYRWKGMERASGWALRGRALADILARSMQRIWRKKDLEAAEAEAARVGEGGELSHTAATGLRANSVIRAFKADPHNNYLVKLHLVSKPLQTFLNEVQKQDGKVCSLIAALASDPAAPATAVLKSECEDLNCGFFSGKYGRRVVQDFLTLIQDFHHPNWLIWEDRGEAAEASKIDAAVVMCRTMVDAWHRLIHYVEDTRFALLYDICSGGGEQHAALDRRDQISTVVARFREKQARCPRCLDFFCERMLDLAEADADVCYNTASHACALARVGSAVVERVHLVGQDLYRAKAKQQRIHNSQTSHNLLGQGFWVFLSR